jgi:prepilin-type N-terminal cleavage/methylation domain-containing protein
MARERGFTLIELLIVVVVIGIQAAIAIPKYSAMKAKSFIATVTSDRKSLASREDIHYGSNQVYASDLNDLTQLTLSERVVVTINEADGTGWAATGYREGLPDSPCGIFYGDAQAANATPATTPGVVACTQ